MKRFDRRGFTLIELLAVILILGIIALIAMPTISTIISDSKKQTFLVTAKEIAEAISDKCNLNFLKGQNDSGTYSISNGNIKYDVDIKGKLPENGTININDKCEVELISYQDKMCSYKGYDDDNVTSGEIVGGACQINGETVEIGYLPTEDSCFTFDEETKTITDYDLTNESCLGTIVIPEKINNIDVERIGDGAFINDYEYLLFFNTSTGYDVYDGIVQSHAIMQNIYPVTNLPSDLTKTCYKKIGDKTGDKFAYNEHVQYETYYFCTLDNLPEEFISENKVTTTGIDTIDFSHAVHLIEIGNAISTDSTVSKVVFGNLPNLTTIGSAIFKNNNISGNVDLSGLSSIRIIPASIFLNNNIEEVIFNDNVTQIYNFSFQNNQLKSLKLPNKINVVSPQAFAENDIRNLVLPNSLEQVGNYAFYENKNMDTLVLGTNLDSILAGAFRYCGLNKITSNSSKLQYIVNWAFADNNLKKIDFPSVEYLYMNAFSNNKLEEVVIPSNILGIANQVFSGNPTLKSITINKASMSGAKWGAPTGCAVNYKG